MARQTDEHGWFRIFYFEAGCAPLSVWSTRSFEDAKLRTAALAAATPGRYVVQDPKGQIVATADNTNSGALVWE